MNYSHNRSLLSRYGRKTKQWPKALWEKAGSIKQEIKKPALNFPHVFYTFGHLIQYSKEKHRLHKNIPSWQQPILVKELSKTPSFTAFQMYG